ncbi:hypothetical protein [Streptomyces sp. enrichment culture]
MRLRSARLRVPVPGGSGFPYREAREPAGEVVADLVPDEAAPSSV